MDKNSKKPSLVSVFVGQPIFAQILKYLGKDTVDAIARRHNSDYYVKRLRAYSHLAALLFGVMSHCVSLREIVLALAVEQRKLLHLSIVHKITRSSLARANRKRSPDVFESVYYALLERWGGFLRDSRIGKFAARNLYAMDSSTITLFCDILKGTGKPRYADGRQKGGLKVHALMDVEKGVPCLVRLSEAAKGDVKFMDMACELPRGSFITMDRAYCDHAVLHRLSGLGIWYVSRMKSIVAYKLLKPLEAVSADAARGWVAKDECVKVSLGKRGKKWHVCRRIEYTGIVKDRSGKEGEKQFVFVTNNLKLPAQTIAEIYRSRWQIELLFKKIKQNFQLKYFYGDSENAIKNQVWAALIACLLLAVIHKEASSKRKWAFSNMASVIRKLLMSYADLNLILSDPEMFAREMFAKRKPKQNLFTLAGMDE